MAGIPRTSTAHAELGEAFFDVVEPAAFPRHVLRFRNDRWAARIGLDGLSQEAWIEHFGRFRPMSGSLERPLALRYHGHQFRSYNPDLGDGRGFLFAQFHDLEDGRLLDLATKGSGTTPWSRQGDGRLTLKGGMREVLATEMLEALGVYTSKSFSLIETGEALFRGDEPSPTRSAVLVRLGHSHIRIGTFQRLRFHEDAAGIERLLDHAVRHYMPHVWHEDRSTRATAFLEEVCRRVARTGAQWMLAGFVHGVLNSDNINITGESFDYGPWRFLPVLDPAFTAAYFDHGGLYAFGRQPHALMWNLTRLAECLLPLADKPALESALEAFEPALHAAFTAGVLRRLGLRSRGEATDAALARALWSMLAETRAPFEETLFDLFGGLVRLDRDPKRRSRYAGAPFAGLREALAGYEPVSEAVLEHPYFAGTAPCSMLIEEVEAIWAPIDAQDDWSVFEAKIAAIRTMGDAYANAEAARADG